MNTRFLLVTSASFLVLTGILLSFSPEEVLNWAGIPASSASLLITQLGGALYFGFGFMNFSARGAIIGGIYNKPIALGNFAHFLIGSLSAIKLLISNSDQFTMIYLYALIYIGYAIAFGIINFRHPPAPVS